MSDEPGQVENPYASPQHTVGAGVEPSGLIRPALTPTDALDVFIGIVNVLLALSVLLGIPIAGISVVEYSLNLRGGLAPLMLLVSILFFIPTAFWCAWMTATVVQSVSIDEDGLHFQRRFCRPEEWPWNEIVAIRTAGRWEVAWYGWIRPLLRPRERTNCMSAVGHYRIQGKVDYRFFPPKNREAFLEAVALHRPDLLKHNAD